MLGPFGGAARVLSRARPLARARASCTARAGAPPVQAPWETFVFARCCSPSEPEKGKPFVMFAGKCSARCTLPSAIPGCAQRCLLSAGRIGAGGPCGGSLPGDPNTGMVAARSSAVQVALPASCGEELADVRLAVVKPSAVEPAGHFEGVGGSPPDVPWRNSA